jgi:hypothetical protein
MTLFEKLLPDDGKHVYTALFSIIILNNDQPTLLENPIFPFLQCLFCHIEPLHLKSVKITKKTCSFGISRISYSLILDDGSLPELQLQTTSLYSVQQICYLLFKTDCVIEERPIVSDSLQTNVDDFEAENILADMENMWKDYNVTKLSLASLQSKSASIIRRCPRSQRIEVFDQIHIPEQILKIVTLDTNAKLLYDMIISSHAKIHC